jgi:tripartite-type tricarboxylate transporter receptor subunit TctC
MSGEVHCGLLSAAAVVQLIHGGRLKAFVTTSESRLLQLPEVPTLGEVGFPGLASLNWLGFFLPVGTSSAIVEKMHKTSVEAMQRPDIKNALASRLIQTEVSGSPNDFEKFVTAETKRWTEIIQRNHIKNQ